MSTEVRWRRGTDAQHAAFIGAMSEITHDTTNNNLRVHDGVTRFYYTGAAADKAVIDWSTSNALDTDGTYGNSWARIGGFSVEPRNAANYGVRITAKSWFEADDIKIVGAVEKNFWFRSTVSWSGRSLRSYGSKIGMHVELSNAPLAYSVPNNITLIDCTLGNATSWGIYARNCGPINLIGGSFEVNGTQSEDASGGIYIIRNDAGIGVEAVALNAVGVYFEHNKGGADIYASQQSAAYAMIINAPGCNFNRVDGSSFTVNNIRLEILNSGKAILNSDGAGFNFGGSYTPSASRRTIDVTGNVGNGLVNYGKTSVFRSSIDAPTHLKLPGEVPESFAFALLRCQPTGEASRKHNIQAVTKTGTGNYKVDFVVPASSGSPQCIGNIVGSIGTLNVTAEAASTVTVTTTNATGVATDQAFNLTVFDG